MSSSSTNIQNPEITGIHLVGSVPLPSALGTFTTVSNALSSRLKRLPDGEPGGRGNFITWQKRIIGKHPILFNSFMQSRFGLPAETFGFSEVRQLEVLDKLHSEAGQLETEFDVFALESYKHFAQLKKDGVIPKDVRFLVCLPTPLTATSLFIRPEMKSEFSELYEAALLRALHRMQNEMPREELSIQWDAPLEMAMLGGIDFYGRGRVEAYWEGDVEAGIVRRMARLVDSVADRVEVGVHLCYGDIGRTHFSQPKDTGLMTYLAKAVIAQSRRKVDFIHMPVPKDRTDEAYFQPLADLKEEIDRGLELSLGLVHEHDLLGTKQRVQAAGTVVQKFSVSTECGMGRMSTEELGSILEIFAAVA